MPFLMSPITIKIGGSGCSSMTGSILILWVSFQISMRVHHQWVLLSCDYFAVRMEYLCSGPCTAIDRFADYKPGAVERTLRPFGWGALVEYTHSHGNQKHCFSFVLVLFSVMKLQRALFRLGLWKPWHGHDMSAPVKELAVRLTGHTVRD